MYLAALNKVTLQPIAHQSCTTQHAELQYEIGGP